MHGAYPLSLMIAAYALYVLAAWILFTTCAVPSFGSYALARAFPHHVDGSWEAESGRWRAQRWGWPHDEAAEVALRTIFNLALVTLFGLQHSVMARAGFKDWLARMGLPRYAERSLYVLASALIKHCVIAHFAPVPAVIWCATGVVRGALQVAQLAFVAVLLYTLFALDFAELMGIRQCKQRAVSEGKREEQLQVTGLYAYVRHPMMAAFLGVMWCTPTFTFGHLMLALMMTAYITIAVRCFEGPDLRRSFKQYAEYEHIVPSFVPSWIVPPAQLRKLGQQK